MMLLLQRLGDMGLAWVERLPSTNARIATSLLLADVVVVKAVWIWQAPPWEVLLFLAAMMGIDLAQFAWKRHTTNVALMPPGRVSGERSAPEVPGA